MKKIFFSLSLVSTLFIAGLNTASAQYYNNYNYGYNYTPYYNTYANAPASNSYQFTQGCYIYNYDRYTGITSLLGSNCSVGNYNYGYNNMYSYGYNYGYVQPTYTTTYIAPYQNTYNYGYNNQYGTYRYVNGVWIPSTGYNYNYNGSNIYNYGNTGCYYTYGTYVCN